MNTDNTLQCVLPALSLGYSVHPDDQGRLAFKNASVCIKYVSSEWLVTDFNSDKFKFSDLKTALLEFHE